MKTPGFTAEFALKPHERLSGAIMSKSLASANVVIPQVSSTGFCMDACDEIYSGTPLNDFCKLSCLANGGGGTGGHGTLGRPTSCATSCRLACNRNPKAYPTPCYGNCVADC